MPKKSLTPGVEEEFKSLMGKRSDGLLKARDVVELAKNEASPLHEYFTWDDTEAARKWRLEEAKLLIRSYTVYNEELKIDVRALTSLDTDRNDGGGFRWTMEVIERPDLRQQLIETALRELNSVRDKYGHIKELVQIWEAIESQNR